MIEDIHARLQRRVKGINFWIVQCIFIFTCKVVGYLADEHSTFFCCLDFLTYPFHMIVESWWRQWASCRPRMDPPKCVVYQALLFVPCTSVPKFPFPPYCAKISCLPACGSYHHDLETFFFHCLVQPPMFHLNFH